MKPNQNFFNSENHQIEVQALGQSGWFYLGHRSEFSEKNRFYRKKVWNFEVIVLRTEGMARCWLNVCPHKGMSLCQKDDGQVSLVCPYHGLAFDTSGKCRNLEHYKGLFPNVNGFDLQALVIESVGDFLFCSQQPLEPLQIAIGSFWEELSNWSTAIDRVVKVSEFTVNQNWKLLMENFIEDFHTYMVHPSNLGLAGMARLSENYFYEFASQSSMLKSNRSATDPRVREILEKRTKTRPYKLPGYHHFHLFPSFNMACEFGSFWVHIGISPISSNQTSLVCKFYLTKTPDQPGIGNSHIDFIQKAINRVITEDMEIVQHFNSSLEYFNDDYEYSLLEGRAKHFSENIKRFLPEK